MSEKAELEIPNFPSSTNQSSLRELARISWTLFPANSWSGVYEPSCEVRSRYLSSFFYSPLTILAAAIRLNSHLL